MENFMKRNMECKEHREMDCTKKVMLAQEVDESTTNNKDVWKEQTYCTKPRLLETGPEDHDEMKFKNNTLFEDTKDIAIGLSRKTRQKIYDKFVENSKSVNVTLYMNDICK